MMIKRVRTAIYFVGRIQLYICIELRAVAIRCILGTVHASKDSVPDVGAESLNSMQLKDVH